MRFNIYKFIHKTIRGQISELMIQAGKTTYGDAGQVLKLHQSTINLASFLGNHALREDNFVHPALKEKAFPEMDLIEKEHAVTDVQLKGVVSQITNIKDEVSSSNPNPDSLNEKGYDFYLSLGAFTGLYFTHMNTEERKIMPFLWENASPDEIFSIHSKMQETVTNQEIIDTIPLMYPYLDFHESVKLTKMLKDEKEFPEMLKRMRECLEQDVFESVVEHAGVISAQREDSAVAISRSKSNLFPLPKKKKKESEIKQKIPR